MVPFVGESSFAINDMSTLLPDPLEPAITAKSPSSIAKLMFSKAVVLSGKVFVTSLISIAFISRAELSF